MRRALRFLVAGSLATVIVAVLMASVLWGFGLLERPQDGIEAHPVDVLSSSARIDVGELIDGPSRPELPELPPMEEIPPLEIPTRRPEGFVQVEFQVDESGRVQSARVVNALPAGVYEDEALEQVRSRRWVPDPRGGTLTEVVRFSVPESTAGDD